MGYTKQYIRNVSVLAKRLRVEDMDFVKIFPGEPVNYLQKSVK